MSPLAMASPGYEGPRSLGFSKYASSSQRKEQLVAASAVPLRALSSSETTIATKQQIAASETQPEATPPAAELAIHQGIALRKEVEEHTKDNNSAMSNAIDNTRQLLKVLRETVPGSKVVDDLWQELERLFAAANNAKAALPSFMEKQRDNMSLYHSSLMNETIRDTQDELNLQHKKVNTQHNLILEQQGAFQHYRAQTDAKLKENEALQERVSRLTLEKGNFRTEVDKYKHLLDREGTQKSADLETAKALQKEFEALVLSNKQLKADHEALRKKHVETVEQGKQIEQRVANRYAKDVAARDEELQKEQAKTASLNVELTTSKKEVEKTKNDNRLLNTKYNNQASEHATLFTKFNEKAKNNEALTSDNARLQDRNAEVAKANAELSKANKDMSKQMNDLTVQLNKAKDGMQAAQGNVQVLMARLATQDASPSGNNDKALMEKIKALEEKRDTLEVTLAEWTELAKRSYKEYKDMLPTYKEAEKYRLEAHDKESQISDLKFQLAAATSSQSKAVGIGSAGGDTAYWKMKYETLLSTIG